MQMYNGSTGARPYYLTLHRRHDMKRRLLNILFWSVLSAAFIGPGTITTAASAGTEFGFALVWALIFSTIACVVLQEASARLTTVSGKNLGEALRQYLHANRAGRFTLYLILGAILTGCAAYEAGNILGAVSGVSLIMQISPTWVTLAIGVCAGLLLWFGTIRVIARIMGVVVAFMGLCFLTTAIVMQPSLGELLQGGFLPSFPAGSELLILGLIGTTVVPYNLFLGSGIANDQTLSEMRASLTIAIGLGGLISIGVLVVGTAIAGSFSFEALAAHLGDTLGGWAATFLGLGLFAAGFTSAMTAPLAASITTRSMVASSAGHPDWQEQGTRFRSIWAVVLVIGILFGLFQVQPVPAIILAQALNGIILPLVAVFLFLMANNHGLLQTSAINSGRHNMLMGLVVCITVMLGVSNLARALTRFLPVDLVDERLILYGSLLAVALLVWPVWHYLSRLRQTGL